MAIIAKHDGDTTVATIAVRNAIPKKFDGMQVMVLDASGDASLGAGQALYQYSSVLSSWVLLWASALELTDLDSRLSALENVGSGSSLQHAVLTQTQVNSTTTEVQLDGFLFTIPAGKSAVVKAQLIFMAAATTTGAFFGVRVSQGNGADGNAVGSWFGYTNLSSAAAATGLSDGDSFNLSAATVTSSGNGILGTAVNSVSVNHSAMISCMLKNNSTNADSTIQIMFRSEVAGSAVTAQIGTMATCIIG